MPDQFNPAVPAIQLGFEGDTLAIRQGCPVFAGGSVTLYTAGTPIGIPSSGTIGDNGALSGLTAFSTTYPGIYLFFPAGAISAGSAAGFYFTVMTSATAGKIFNNLLSLGQRPFIIKDPKPFVTTGPGAYTQALTLQTLLQVAVLGGSLRANGACEMIYVVSLNSSIVGTTFNLNYGGQSIDPQDLSGTEAWANILWIYNKGVVNKQVVMNFLNIAELGGSPNVFLSVNTGNDFNISFDATLSTATDWIVLEALTARSVVATP